TASSTGSCRGKTCGPKSPASSISASTDDKLGCQEAKYHRELRRFGSPGKKQRHMGVFSRLTSLFGGKNKPKLPKVPKLPRIDIAKRFDLVARTGQGSMSQVWRARDHKIGRVVCLKILDKEKTNRFAARFPGLSRPIEGEVLMAMKH